MSFIEIKDDKDDLRQEYARLLLENNIIYEGECFKGEIIGYGKMIYPDGQIDIGKFFNGKLNGYGKRFYINGNIYEGEFVEGIEHGKGKIVIKTIIGNVKLTQKGNWIYGKKVSKIFSKIKR